MLLLIIFGMVVDGVILLFTLGVLSEIIELLMTLLGFSEGFCVVLIT
jgi:hypothetical protein